MEKYKLGVLVSGYGANLNAIMQEAKKPYFPAVIDCVISNNEDAHALVFAGSIPKFVVQRKQFGSFEACDDEIDRILTERKVDYVCLAGFKRILGPKIVKRWENKMMNIHPALLPSFPGLEGAAQAFNAGVKIAGCTVHFVVEQVDAGPIIAQAAVAVLPKYDADDISDRILEAELICYSYAIMKVLKCAQDTLDERRYFAYTKGILLN